MELDTVNWKQDQLQQHVTAGVALDQLTLRLQTLEHLVERQRQLIAAKVSLSWKNQLHDDSYCVNINLYCSCGGVTHTPRPRSTLNHIFLPLRYTAKSTMVFL